MEGGVKFYAGEIMDLALPCLQDRSWDVKRQGALCIAVVAEKAYAQTLHKDLGRIVDALVGALPGRTWEGKESVARALASVCVSCEQEFVSGKMNILLVHEVLLRELSKTDLVYKSKLVPFLATFYKSFITTEILSSVCTAIFPALKPQVTEGAGNKDEVLEEQQIQEKVQTFPFSACTLFSHQIRHGSNRLGTRY